MEYRNLGTSGLKVSALSIGGWLTFGEGISDESTGAVLRAAIDGGVNFIDLADVYANGRAEQSAARFLGDYRRSDLVISSKLFWPMSDDINDRGLSRKHIMESIDRSLGNLDTDYLDIYFCHREDPETPIEETVRAMDDLVRRGKILYWGTSVWSPKALRSACRIAGRLGCSGPVAEQPPYSLLRRGIEKKVLPTARTLGLGLVVWSPLAGGVLTGKYNHGVPRESRGAKTRWLEQDLTSATLDRVRRFTELARRKGLEPEQLALAWLLQRKGLSSAIMGATSADQVVRNLKSTAVQLGGVLLEELEELFPA